MALFRDAVVLERQDLLEPGILQYARGFVVADAPPVAPSHWTRTLLGGAWHLRWDPRNPFAHAAAGTNEVVLIGRAAHLDAPEAPLAELAERLAGALAQGAFAFQDEVDALLGRFVVLRLSGRDLRIQTDAAGSRPLAFSEKAPYTAASHTRLVAENIGAEPSEFAYGSYFRENGMFQFPGRRTEYASVLSLTPNTELRLDDGSVVRIFPRREVARCDLQQATSLVLQAGSVLARALRKERRVLLSLSAGVDSRSSLAMLRPLADEIELFTYDLTYGTKNSGNRYDRDAAEAIAARNGLQHHTLAVDEREPVGAVKTALHQATRATHSRRLARAYLEELPIDAVHVRSHVHGIVKGTYQKWNYSRNNLDGAALARIASAGKATDGKISDAFDEYRHATTLDELHGYDPLDVFYWEYRSALIQAPAMLEADLAMDSISPLSCRRLLAALLGMSVEEKKSAQLFLTVIERCWPELLEVPVNGRDIATQGYR